MRAETKTCLLFGVAPATAFCIQLFYNCYVREQYGRNVTSIGGTLLGFLVGWLFIYGVGSLVGLTGLHIYRYYMRTGQFQFGLRSVALLTALTGLLLGVAAPAIRRSQADTATLRELEGLLHTQVRIERITGIPGCRRINVISLPAVEITPQDVPPIAACLNRLDALFFVNGRQATYTDDAQSMLKKAVPCFH